MAKGKEINRTSLFRMILATFGAIIIMLLSSVLIHGYLLNDFDKLLSSHSELKFYGILFCIYSIMAVSIIILIRFFSINTSVVLKCIVLGAAIGVVVFVMGSKFDVYWFKNTSRLHLGVNLGWQVVEQLLGCLTAGIILNIRYNDRAVLVLP